MRGKLRLVATGNEYSADNLVKEAIEPLPANATGIEINARAVALARDTIAVMRREDEPAILASVTLVIPDQAMKVAFLEAVGQQLI